MTRQMVRKHQLHWTEACGEYYTQFSCMSDTSFFSFLLFSSLLFSFLSSLLLYSFILSFLYCSFSFINSHNLSWASLPLSNRKISHLSLLLLVGFICPTHIKILNESNPVNPLKMPQTRHQSQWTGRQ